MLVLDIRSAIDGGGAEAYQKGHIPGAVHSDYDKAGWRVTRNGVPFMLPTLAELEKLIGETGIDEDSHVVVVPAGVHVTDFGSAARVYWTLEGRGRIQRCRSSTAALPPGQADDAIRSRPAPSKPSPKIFTATLDKSLLAEPRGRSDRAQVGGATLIDARPAAFFAGKAEGAGRQGLRPHPGRDQSRQRDVLRSARPTGCSRRPSLPRSPATLPAGPVGHLLQHRPLGGDRLVRAVGDARPARTCGSITARWSTGPPMRSRPVASARTKWDDLKKALGFGS